MLGAIVGDIIGSVYELQNIKTKDFPLFRDDCTFTDDTVMTIATAEALLKGAKPEDFISSYRKFGRLYPDAGYGGNFYRWLMSDSLLPYNSYGNGSAMRVSPVVTKFCDLSCVEDLAKRSAEVSHSHPEGIKGAQATAAAIYIVKTYVWEDSSIEERKAKMKLYIESTYGYNLSRSLDEIRPAYTFNVSCQETVPQAIIAFLESTSFEDAIRNAVSLGGDSDTLAAITGSIAEAAYGVPIPIRKKALSYLPEPLLKAYFAWYQSLHYGTYPVRTPTA